MKRVGRTVQQQHIEIHHTSYTLCPSHAHQHRVSAGTQRQSCGCNQQQSAAALSDGHRDHDSSPHDHEPL